jgi:hypothetical protein
MRKMDNEKHLNTRYSLLIVRYLDDQVKKTEMGRTCGAYGGEERCIQGFSGET